MITDEVLLALCERAVPGTGEHRRACRTYRRAVLEWRERDQAARQAEADRIVAALVDDTAREVWPAMMRDRQWRAAA